MSDERAPRTSYDDLETPAQMRADCLVVGDNLRLERDLRDARFARSSGTTARAAVRPAPSLAYDDFPRDVRKRDIRVSDAAARLAGALHLHLD